MLLIEVAGGPTRVLTPPFPSLCFNLSQCQLQDSMEQVFPKDPCDCPHSLLSSTWARDYPRATMASQPVQADAPPIYPSIHWSISPPSKPSQIHLL